MFKNNKKEKYFYKHQFPASTSTSTRRNHTIFIFFKSYLKLVYSLNTYHFEIILYVQL